MSLPTFQAALGNLRRTGEMLPPYTCPELDVTYEHPRKGSLPIAIDDRVLPAVGTLYTNNRALGEAVRSKFDHQTRTLAHAQAILLDALQVSAPVWGFAGYTGTGIGYDTEAAGIGKFYRHLGQLKYKPKLIVDGGVSTGVLGLSSIFAKSLHIPTLGFIPFKGLSSIGPRTHMVVCGATYPNRQVAVAAASDILVCWGRERGNDCRVLHGDRKWQLCHSAHFSEIRARLTPRPVPSSPTSTGCRNKRTAFGMHLARRPTRLHRGCAEIPCSKQRCQPRVPSA